MIHIMLSVYQALAHNIGFYSTEGILQKCYREVYIATSYCVQFAHHQKKTTLLNHQLKS